MESLANQKEMAKRKRDDIQAMLLENSMSQRIAQKLKFFGDNFKAQITELEKDTSHLDDKIKLAEQKMAGLNIKMRGQFLLIL